MFKEVWEVFTVTTIMIVPILGTYWIMFKHKTGYYSPILLFFLDNGMKNCYIGVNKDTAVLESPGEFLYLLFNRDKALECCSNYMTLYYSTNEAILDWALFDSVYFVNDQYIVYRISIPEEWKADIEIIYQGRYSEVSDSYKTGVKPTKNLTHKVTSELTNFVIRKSIASKVSTKDLKFKEYLEDYFSAKIPSGRELFKRFSKSKEILDIDLLI